MNRAGYFPQRKILSGVVELVTGKDYLKKIKIHANSLHHVKAYQIYDNWKKNRVIDKNRDSD